MAIWKKADENFPEIPTPEDHGWVKENGQLEPLWCQGDVLPAELINIMEEEEHYDSDSLEMMFDSDVSEFTDDEFIN